MPTNERTLLAARRGDRVALSDLLRQLQDPWFRFSLSLLGCPDRARDAAQETGLRFLKALPAFRGDSQLQTWSLGIALNVCREMRRRNRPMPSDGHDHLLRLHSDRQDAPAAPHASAELSEDRERLKTVLADLPERQREAIVLRFFEDLSVEDTAAAMQCAQGTVKATVHQALRSLRNRLTAASPARITSAT